MTNKRQTPKTARGTTEVLVRSDRADITDLRGLLERRRKRSVSVEAMNAAIVRQHSKKS